MFDLRQTNIFSSEKITLLFSLFSLGLGLNTGVALSAPINRTLSTVRCEPIGRLIGSGDSKYASGSLLCAEDRLSPKKSVKVLCYKTERVLTLAPGRRQRVQDACGQRRVRLPLCNVQLRLHCLQVKGGQRPNHPELLQPIGTTLIEPRPQLAWRAVDRADRYVISVSGVGINWQESTTDTTLPYPSKEMELRFGQAYKVDIVAYQDDQPINASRSVLVLLPESVLHAIETEISLIKALPLSSLARVWRDLVTVYRSKNLLSEAIELLEDGIHQGVSDPSIQRTLGDLYLEVGNATQARNYYERAKELAEMEQNQEELKRAQAGLALIARWSGEQTK